MSSILEGFKFAWNKNRDYGPKLVADLDESAMARAIEPAGGAAANHPAWIFSHLNVYLPVIAAIIKNESFDDPRDHPFGMLSHPQPDASLYPSRDQLVEAWLAGHDEVNQLLDAADDSVLHQQIQLPRWQAIMPTAAIALPYLMFNHENMHLGQLSAWRRVQGLPSV